MLFKYMTILIVMLGLLSPGVLFAQSDNTLMTQEYFVEQRAGEGLLLRISAFESEFESRVVGRGGNLIVHTAMPGSRIVPLFQYVNEHKNDRQISIRVSSRLHTARSEFGLALTRVRVWDDRSNSIDRAYRQLSFGMEAGSGGSAANWTVKIDSLANASRLFERFGMKEMRLWADYMVAHLIYRHLHDYSIVSSMCREILAEVQGTHFNEIELASLRLQTNALIGLKRSGAIEVPANGPDPVQSALLKTATLARSMGFYYEQAQALSLSGAGYVADSAYTQALNQYQMAVDIADRVGDAELATDIRESIVKIHAVLGNVPESSAVLQQIETQLVEEGGGDDLALNLLAQGRLFIRSYHFLKAYEVLTQALIQQNNSAIRRQANYELARVFYATGRFERAKTYLQLAGISIPASEKRRNTSVISVAEGLGMLANIYRSEADYDQMRRARSAQGQFQPSQAVYRYEQALDELAPARKNVSKARSLFAESQQAASAAGLMDIYHLAVLQMCALGGDNGGSGTCTNDKLTASYRRLKAGGVPKHSVEGMYLWARILLNNGRQTQALDLLAELTTDIQFYRHALPGVLGTWYRQRSQEIFEFYLAQVLQRADQTIVNDDAAGLLALTRIRFAEKYSESDSVPADEFSTTELLRLQLGEREEADSEQLITSLNDSINSGLAELRPAFDQQFHYLSAMDLQNYLGGLSGDEVLLTYHLTPTTSHAWVGTNSGVQRVSVPNSIQLYRDLQYSREGLSSSGVATFESRMSSIGSRLLSPVSHLLKETIYFLPAGSLLGMPFDALRHNSRYLVEDHRVVNLTAFPQNINSPASLTMGTIDKVFLAGHPQDYSSSYLTHLDTSTEISSVADIFVGPGLNIIQGAALLPDEFQTEQYLQADLIHLAMPADIDLKYPEQSSFILSGLEGSSERAIFSSIDILQNELRARLVFLSGSEIDELPVSEFTNQPALITDFQKAGSNAVISSLWAIGGTETEDLIRVFYESLKSTDNLSVSLQAAKRHYLATNRDGGLYDWAALQLYIK